MKYNKPRRLALDETAPIGLRYRNLLRCVTFIAKKNDQQFWQLLHFLDSGFMFEVNQSIASVKIIKAIEKLDEKSGEVNSDKGRIPHHISEFSSSKSKELRKSDKKSTWLIFQNILKKLLPVRSTKTSLSQKEIEQIFKSEFNDLVVPLREHADSIYELLKKKLNHLEEVVAFPLQKREKSWNSVLDKIKDNESEENSNGMQNIKSVTDIQDLIGLRVVTVFEQDILKVEQVFHKYFKVERSYTPRYGSYKPNYPVRHVILKSSLKPSKATKFKKPVPILVEVQIMTLAQFTFAKASHSLIYKNRLPRKLRESRIQSLQKVSALLECVDTELSRNKITE